MFSLLNANGINLTQELPVFIYNWWLVPIYTDDKFIPEDIIMQIMHRKMLTILVASALLMMTGCGQKGDLYLPQGNLKVVKVG